MISTPTWVSAQSVMEYHFEQKDNYYQKEGDSGQWYGRGAEALGFKQGEAIKKEDLEKVLFGQNKQGEQVQKVRLDAEGDRIRAAIDITFSAPKSVSIMYETALANGDYELAQAVKEEYLESVKEDLRRFEDYYAQTRITADGITQRVDTGNLVIATFTHEVARPVTDPVTGITTVDPSLHVHAVIINATQYNGKWMSIETKKIFENYMKEGMIQRGNFASRLNNNLGFDIRITDAQKGFYELKNVDDRLIDEMSGRSKQIEKLIDDLKAQYPDKSE